MCEIGYHHCSVCQEEYKCDQLNSECPVMNHYETPCEKCEWWVEEERKDADKQERLKWERQEWEREHTFHEN